MALATRVTPVVRSRTNTSVFALPSLMPPVTKLPASAVDTNATKRPSVLTDRALPRPLLRAVAVEVALAVVRDTREIAPERSQITASVPCWAPTTSPGTRSGATVVNAMALPSPEIAGRELAPRPGVPLAWLMSREVAVVESHR